jgi:uncharacterized protein
MSKILETITADLKQAMISKEEQRVSVLRMLIAALKNKKIELGNKEELTDEQAINVLSSEIKKRKDSIEAYEQGNRNDLATKEKQEIEIIIKYMPEQMSEEEVAKKVKEIISGLSDDEKKNFGRVMGLVIGQLKGKAEGSLITSIVKKLLV